MHVGTHSYIGTHTHTGGGGGVVGCLRGQWLRVIHAQFAAQALLFAGKSWLQLQPGPVLDICLSHVQEGCYTLYTFETCSI